MAYPPAKTKRMARQVADVLGLDLDKVRGLTSRELIELYVHLNGLTGGDPTMMCHWLQTENRHLAGVPADLIGSPGVRERALAYFDRVAIWWIRHW